MKFKKSLVSIIVCAFTFFLVSTNVFAVDVQNKLKDVPVTEGLLNEGYIPKKYYVDSFSSLAGSSNNPYYIENVLQYANLSKFSLRDIIPENVVIRDQGKENSCWAFSTIACLESNLALKNKQKGKPTKVYDFSEQYMVSGSFYDNYLNGQINKKGLNVKPYVGGNFERAMGNVTSGNGVIDESSYPYLNSEAPVDINSLSNKKVTADILDTVMFESPNNEEQFMKLKKAVKEHIVQNGGVYVALRMPKIGDYKFNPVKGSVYNDVKAAQNHTVTIIGWDDNYPKENFNFKPDNNGAWLVKNSYVAHLEQNVDEVKNEIYEFLKSYFNLNGIHSANEIDDNYLIEALNAEYKRQFNIEPVKLVQGKDGVKYASIDINTGGYLYISYEDKTLSDYIGITRAIEKKDYDNIYQNCYYVSGYRDYLTTNNKKTYGVLLGEQYEANSNDEKLIKFSIRVLSEADYEFYANVNDNDVDMSKLLKLELDNFSTKIHLKPGYHTIYLKEPLKLNSKKFAVATKMLNANSFDVAVGNTNDFNVDWFKYTKLSKNSYLGIIDENENIKLERMNDVDFTLKAYTEKDGNVISEDNDIDKNNSINNGVNYKGENDLKKNSIKSAEVKFYYNKNNKSIRISNINPYIGESKYEFSIIMKDDTNDSNSVLIDKNGVNIFKFSSSDLKKDVNNTYYYDFSIGDNIKNLDDLKRYKLLNLNLKEYVDGNVNERNINFELVNMDNGNNSNNFDRSLLNDDSKKNFVDTTVVKGRLPQTGESILILVIISLLLVLCIIYKIYVSKIK